MSAGAAVALETLTLDIGAMPVSIRTESAELADMLRERYRGYVSPSAEPMFRFDVEAVSRERLSDADDAVVRTVDGRWVIERGDFHAEWDGAARRGWARQSVNPYSFDSALRILHSLLLARAGGLLVHAASAVRNGRAFVFMGVSGAGKTTISRLAPPDATLLTDEISYVRPKDGEYFAYGTPFAGELGEPGANVTAPLAAIYLLEKGPQNRIDALDDATAVRALMQSVLFFAHDPELVEAVFDTACALVRKVPVRRLTFLPDARVWELIE